MSFGDVERVGMWTSRVDGGPVVDLTIAMSVCHATGNDVSETDRRDDGVLVDSRLEDKKT
jgi:hypothetical protein